MDHLVKEVKKPDGDFGLDCHDLSLENLFVDEKDNVTITCIIDWESTTTRPLWACAHVPPFLQTSPFVSKLFREIITQLPTDPTIHVQLPKHMDLTPLCREWLHYENAGTRLRMAHRCAEWDGWEESLVDSILGPEEFEHEWYEGGCVAANEEEIVVVDSPRVEDDDDDDDKEKKKKKKKKKSVVLKSKIQPPVLSRVMKISSKFPPMLQEKDQVLNTTGDICGGRGGELGRRLEAWLSVTGDGDVDNGT